jgi:hypothetical protein
MGLDRDPRNPNMQLETIDVTGLPDQVVEDIQKLVQSIRKNLPTKEGPEARPSPSSVSLPRWEGTMHGSLSRRELYDDVG